MGATAPSDEVPLRINIFHSDSVGKQQLGCLELTPLLSSLTDDRVCVLLSADAGADATDAGVSGVAAATTDAATTATAAVIAATTPSLPPLPPGHCCRSRQSPLSAPPPC